MNHNTDYEFVVLSVGSNIGDRENNIYSAYRLLKESNALSYSQLSSMYETEPVGNKNQGWFINAAIAGKTNLPLNNFIQLCKSIEYSIGRRSHEKWAEREIDIDIVLFGKLLYETEGLTVPHARMHERRFVLVPVSEIAGSALHPKFNKTINELLYECIDNSTVKKIKAINPNNV